jgi:hypothetical protein
LSGERVYSIHPYYGSDALVAPTQPQNSTVNIPTPAVSMAMTVELPLNGKVTNNPPHSIRRREKEKQRESEFPAAIVLLNERRRLISSKEFVEYQKKHHPLKPPSKPSFLAPEIPTVSQLHDGLIYAFRYFHSTATPHATFHDEHQRKVIFHWTQGLGRLIDSWVSESALTSPDSKEAKQAEWNEVIDLLIGLNGLIEESDDRMKRVFYLSTEQGGIDELLHKWQALSNSVRGTKELEEFNDVREEWKYSQSNG